jgi:vacuolar-type H+-ATPase subunit I/STV1
MKFYLAAKGNKKYQKDPEVQALLEQTKQNFNNTPKPQVKTLEERLEEKLDKLEENFEKQEKIIDKLEKKLSTNSNRGKKAGSMADFKKQFKMEFKDHQQVSTNDLVGFINKEDIVDQRSIKNRIQYLVSHEILEPFAPNVYNIKS